MNASIIKDLIESNLAHAKAIVLGEDGRHFEAVVICSDFANKNRVQKQKMVYSTLDKQLSDGTIHAISIKTFTPEEWEKLNHG